MDTEASDSSKKNGFIQHMTNFDKKTKSELLNMFQYGFLLVLPVMFINKLVSVLFSTSTEDKTTLELSLEISAELIVLFSSFFIIHRLVSFIPTYSEEPYPDIQFTQVIFIFVFIIFSFQTSLNEKFQVIYERVFDQAPNNLPILPKKGGEQSNSSSIRVSQPLSAPHQGQQHIGKAQYVNESTMQQMHSQQSVPVNQNVSHVNSSLQVPEQSMHVPQFSQQFPSDSGIDTFTPEPFGGF
jgi:hypothetical protein